ncbi:MAG: hypothetical protein HFK10_05920 [Clostridia bacterium]|nr:hypothetical protein [Clostridia bacterium]
MKAILNIASIIDYSGDTPVVLYSNAVQTTIVTPCDGRAHCEMICCCACCRRCCCGCCKRKKTLCDCCTDC